MKVKIFIIFLCSVAFFMSCDPIEEKISRDRNATLTFSTDTVIFDTLLSSVGSITKRLRIYNPNEQAVEISNLRVGKLDASEYSLIINGLEGKSFSNEVVFGNDSLTILVSVLIDPQDENLPYLVKDSVVVESNGNEWNVKLVSYGQDAVFINNAQFICDATLTADRPYVISGFAFVDTNCVLTMEAGTTVLFDNSAFLAVAGTLLVAGDTANPVILRNARLDERFSDVPGQWTGIYFQDGSNGNVIDHAVISNSEIGISIGNPDNITDIDLQLSNTVIENMSLYGVFTVNASVMAYNNVIYNCGLQSIANFGGGTYTYLHNTFANTPNSFIRDEPSVVVANFLPLEVGNLINDLRVNMTNNIIWGDLNEELLIVEPVGNSLFDVTVTSNIIRSELTDWEELGNFVSTSRNFPGFFSPNLREYRLDTLAFAKDKGIDAGIDFDILQMPRDEMPDIGAYERIEN